MSIRMKSRPRMPVRSLLVVAMVGVLAGCGGGSSEPEPQRPALSWQDSGFYTPVVTDAAGQGQSEHLGQLRDVAISPSGTVHLAWHTPAPIGFRGDGYLSSSHDGGVTWQAMKIAPDWGVFDFVSVLSSGLVVAGSTMDLPQYWWLSPRLWWSEDDGVTWHYQDIETDFDVPAEEPDPPRYVVEPMGMVEHQGKKVVWVRQRSDLTRDRLYYWNQGTATLDRLPIVLPATSPLPVQDGYWFNALAVGQNGYLYLAIAGEVFRTLDGLAWETLPRANADAGVTSLTVLADGTLAAGLSNQENVYFYQDGPGWRQSLLPEDQEDAFGSPVRANMVEHIIELESGALLVAAEDLVYASCNSGESWEHIVKPPEASLYQPHRLAQAPDGTVWGTFNCLPPGSMPSYDGKLLKMSPPAGVAARDFVKCR